MQNSKCKTKFATRQLQNDNCNTTIVTRQLQNDNWNVAIEKQQLKNIKCFKQMFETLRGPPPEAKKTSIAKQ